MKKRSFITVAVVISVMAALAVFSGAVKAEDPSDSYVKQTAEYEDSTIALWFEHSFKKVMTSDVTPSGRDTYSVYMAKNEIENAQFILYSDDTHTGMNATVTDFTDGKGNTVEAELWYQMYVTLSDLATTSYLGATTSEESFIREGEQPEALVPLASQTKGFKLNGGKSQAFYIRLKSTPDTVSGWYSAQLNILNSDGNCVKTATVYAYVWDFEISEKTALQTSFYVENVEGGVSQLTYQEAYDYLLENRLNAMDIPGNFNSENEYLTNDRVSAIRVSSGVTGTATNAYINHEGSFASYKDIYNDISNMPEWEDIKDKFYFYTVDEATSADDAYMASRKNSMDEVIAKSEKLSNYWPDAQVVLPQYENHIYPYGTATSPVEELTPGTYKDSVQATFDTDAVQLWCPQIYAFTPLEVLKAYNYDGKNVDLEGGALYKRECQVTSFSSRISGAILAGQSYYNWEEHYGELDDRILSYNLTKEEQGSDSYQLWTYCAGWNKSYTYCNHLIENSGLQTKMLFWQLYQLDITGYLYYGTNNWNEYDDENGSYIDRTVTGSKVGSFKTNGHVYPVRVGDDEEKHTVWGNGVLFYTTNMAKINTGYNLAGTIRVELMRDGVEEYQMLTMLEELCGSAAADEIVDSVSDNITSYLSLPGFDRSGFDSSMDDYDVMATVRRELGNAVEAASMEQCDHSYDGGSLTKEPTCKEMGEMTYTCTKCGAVDVKNVPTLHAQGECFELTESIPATCTEAGKEVYICNICGVGNYIDVPANHDDENCYLYEYKNDSTHIVSCGVCGVELESLNHDMWTVDTNTCTEAGTLDEVCRQCGYTVTGEATEAHGHVMRDGVCTVCGYSENAVEPEVTTGDVNGDGKINLSDIFMIKSYIAGQMNFDETQMKAADINGDGKANLADLFLVKNYVSAGVFG